METLSFGLRPVPPFRLDLTVWALRRRARNIVDRWDGSTYRRVLVVDEMPFEVAARQIGSCEHPKLAVTVTGRIKLGIRSTVTQLLTRALGLRANLQPFYELAVRDRRLAPLVEQFRGLKPPRFPSVFEALVNVIACQQLSLTVGIELLNRVATKCGPEKLMKLRGVGRWTAEYVLLRGLGRISMFPGDKHNRSTSWRIRQSSLSSSASQHRMRTRTGKNSICAGGQE